MDPNNQQYSQPNPGQGAPVQPTGMPQNPITQQQQPTYQNAPQTQNPYQNMGQMPGAQNYAQPNMGQMPGQYPPGMMMPGVPGANQPLNAQRPPVNPNSTQNVLQIAEIRDGIVIMNDGTFRSVIMVKSINFDLMSPQERDAVEFSYQGFLNSLYFPIQIFIRSQKVDLREYIERLDKIRLEHENMLLAMLMDDYINYIDMLAAQTNIMDKNFYVVVPYMPLSEDQNQKPLASSKSLFNGVFGMFSNTKTHVVINEGALEAAKTELRNRVQAVLSGLMQCGIQGLPLDTQELIELYYDSYNPDTATRQQLKNFGDLNAPVVTKGEGVAPQPNLEREMQ